MLGTALHLKLLDLRNAELSRQDAIFEVLLIGREKKPLAMRFRGLGSTPNLSGITHRLFLVRGLLGGRVSLWIQ